MGGHYGTIHVRTEDQQRVRSAVEVLVRGGKKRFLIAPPLDGWVTVFPNNNGQDSTISEALAAALPDKTLIHCLVHDDDIFCYWVFERGKLIDSYNSCPDYFDEDNKEPRGGNADALRHLLLDASKAGELQRLLDAERFTFELERQDQFAALLGLPNTDRAYEYLRDGETDGVRQWKQFIHVPDLTSEKETFRAAASQERADYQRLQQDGLLLVGELGKKSADKRHFRAPLWTMNPATSEVFLAWPDHHFNQQPTEPDWIRYGPPDWKGQKVELPPIGPTTMLKFSPGGSWLVVNPPGVAQIDIWDVRENRRATQKRFTGNVGAVEFSADESWLFVVIHNYPPKTEVHRLALRPGLKDSVWTNDQLHFSSLVPHPDGKLLAALDNHGILVVIGLESMEIVHEAWIKERNSLLPEAVVQEIMRSGTEKILGMLKGHKPPEELENYRWQSARHSLPKDPIRVCEFSPAGDLIACGTTGGARVLEWKAVLECDRIKPVPVKYSANAESAKLEFSGTAIEQKSVMGIAYDAVRRRVLFCGLEGKISFLELENGSSGELLTLPARMPLFHLALTHDRTAIAVTGQRFGANSNRDTPAHFQVWSYAKLCERAGVAW